jgi:hypothetical protein
MHWRGLVWLLAFVALVLPPSFAPSTAAAASHPTTTSDCDHHAPPPPCPEKGTAKHAAGLCCPLMAQMVATLPASVATADPATRGPAALPAAVHFTGLSPHKDPPPPRV